MSGELLRRRFFSMFLSHAIAIMRTPRSEKARTAVVRAFPDAIMAETYKRSHRQTLPVDQWGKLFRCNSLGLRYRKTRTLAVLHHPAEVPPRLKCVAVVLLFRTCTDRRAICHGFYQAQQFHASRSRRRA